MKKCPQVRIFFKKEENVGKKLLNTDFLDFIPKAQTTKAKINKWDYITLNSFCLARETIKIKKPPTKWMTTFCKPFII